MLCSRSSPQMCRLNGLGDGSENIPGGGRLRVQILVVIFPLRGELDSLVGAGLGVLEDVAFVIPDHDFFVVVIEDVTGVDRDFAAAAGGVDDELRNAVAGGVTTQAFDDLDSFRDRRAQMG